MLKKITYLLLIILFTTSCQTLGSVKRGITGEKQLSNDEFLVKKKDPLILPPDYENLPSPDEKIAASEEFKLFEKDLETSLEDATSTSGSLEESIIRKIESK
tara:strand:+ start:271 stop:576 length:306 start_codon:yes stop_codon:yes gene_type:complete